MPKQAATQWRPGVEEGFIRLRRNPWKPDHFEAINVDATYWLRKLAGCSMFHESRYDEILAKVSKHEVGLETPYEGDDK